MDNSSRQSPIIESPLISLFPPSPNSGSPKDEPAHGGETVSKQTVPIYTEIPADKLTGLCGANDRNLQTMTTLFGCRVRCRGNRLSLDSTGIGLQKLFHQFLDKLLSYMAQGIEVEADLLDALYCASKDEYAQAQYKDTVSVGTADATPDPATFYDPKETALHLNGKKILPRNRRQHQFLQQMRDSEVIFALGPAGTGKTFLAVAHGLDRLLSGRSGFLLLSRPVVEAGESLGFLPGDFGQKIGPYMLPLFDAIRYLIKPEQVAALESKKMIEVAPLAYMRGRSLRDAIVILDEAQNATPQQIKMLLTRLGEGSQAILTGDPSQSDLGPSQKSGIYQAAQILGKVKGIAIQR
ncbi:MAG: PhoH family protein, partial [Spirochaetota bacterium]